MGRWEIENTRTYDWRSLSRTMGVIQDACAWSEPSNRNKWLVQLPILPKSLTSKSQTDRTDTFPPFHDTVMCVCRDGWECENVNLNKFSPDIHSDLFCNTNLLNDKCQSLSSDDPRNVSRPVPSTSRNPISPLYLLWDCSFKLFIYRGPTRMIYLSIVLLVTLTF